MSPKVSELVRFKTEKLFNGAVNLDWLLKKPDFAKKAASCFVFHGPEYHGVSSDAGDTFTDHELKDTVSFTQSIVKSCVGFSDDSFNLAIAGYGTGKSHLAVSLAELLGNPKGQISESILESIKDADKKIGIEIENYIKNMGKPCLILALNGMENFDLTAEVSKQVMEQVKLKNVDLTPLENLRPRFKEAAKRVELMANISEHQDNILEKTQLPDIDNVVSSLLNQDEKVYEALAPIFEENGLKISVHGGESLKDIFDVVSHNYCGEGPETPFSSIVILFDEFGRYAEFATLKRQIAGSGVLQQLFEGIQNNSEKTTFVGFIQFELAAYLQRIDPEYKNDVLRVITRYQNSAKSYLSTNLETLIANLIEKKGSQINTWLDTKQRKDDSEQVRYLLNKWFPASKKNGLWKNQEKFHSVIKKGCWPFSPFAIWVLYYLSAAGKFLQERSALSLLAEAVSRNYDKTVELDDGLFELAPVNLWSQSLLDEFINSEESAQQGTIAHSYSTVVNKYSSNLQKRHLKVLQAIVLASKIGLYVLDRNDSDRAFCYLTGLNLNEISTTLEELKDEYNIIEWDSNFNLFDILGDAVPRTQFLSFLRQRVAGHFDRKEKSELFVTSITSWCGDLFENIAPDFAEKNEIKTKEWVFKSKIINSLNIELNLRLEAKNWIEALKADEERGTIFYCYLGPGEDIEKFKLNVSRYISKISKEIGFGYLPFLVVILFDENDEVGNNMAELSVLSSSLSHEDKSKFGNLIGAHQEKNIKKLYDQLKTLIKSREYVSAFKDQLSSKRIKLICSEIFEKIYPKVLPFNFDGFATSKGNANKSCYEMTMELLGGKLDHDSCLSKKPKDKNRSLSIFKNSWDCFNKSGKISDPKSKIPQKIIKLWKTKLDSDDEQFIISKELRSICLPPYGANLFSAGLLFAVFVSSRREKICLVDNNGDKFDVSQWLGSDIFTNKCFDLNKIDNTELISIGEASEEWENLINDWEDAETHRHIVYYNNLAEDLEKRIPVPPVLVSSLVELKKQSEKSVESIQRIEKGKNKAWDEIEKSLKYNNIDNVCWQAANLKSESERMKSEGLWLDQEINELENDLGKVRQFIVEGFNSWLDEQVLLSDNPDKVGEYKKHLGKIIYSKLRYLGLNDYADTLKNHVEKQLKNWEKQAEAKKHCDAVNQWITENKRVSGIIKIIDLRRLLTTAKEYKKQLNNDIKIIKLKQLDQTFNNLSNFLQELNKREDELAQKANNLWDSEISNKYDLELLSKDVKDSISIYEGMEDDLEDFKLMQRALDLFDYYYNELNKSELTWNQYYNHLEKFKSEILIKYGDFDLPPWDLKKTIEILSDEIVDGRKFKAQNWISKFITIEDQIEDMNVERADKILKELEFPPAFLSEDETVIATRIHEKARKRCDDFKLEWLFQRFKELPENLKPVFIDMIDSLV
ncbi:MAG: hypothetical protein ACQESP_07540 [Candidatus Muiribacteriota bacterium]